MQMKKKLFILLAAYIMISCMACINSADTIGISSDIQLDCPDNWTVVKEEVLKDSELEEEVVLTNEKGITITCIKWREIPGFYGRIMCEYEAVKAADVEFKPLYSQETDSGDHLVMVKVKLIGSLNMDVDEDFTDVDGSTFYAVIPESKMEQSDGQFITWGSDGHYQEFSFDASTPYTLIAEAPDGQFTEEEQAEVTAILSSLRSKETKR